MTKLLWLSITVTFPKNAPLLCYFWLCVNHGRKACGMRNRRPAHPERQDVLPASCEISCPQVSRWDPRVWELKPRTPTVVFWTHHAVPWLHGCVRSVVSFWHALPLPFLGWLQSFLTSQGRCHRVRGLPRAPRLLALMALWLSECFNIYHLMLKLTA